MSRNKHKEASDKTEHTSSGFAQTEPDELPRGGKKLPGVRRTRNYSGPAPLLFLIIPAVILLAGIITALVVLKPWKQTDTGDDPASAGSSVTLSSGTAQQGSSEDKDADPGSVSVPGAAEEAVTEAEADDTAKSDAKAGAKTEKETAAAPADEAARKAEQIVKGMSDEEKLAQLFLITPADLVNLSFTKNEAGQDSADSLSGAASGIATQNDTSDSGSADADAGDGTASAGDAGADGTASADASGSTDTSAAQADGSSVSLSDAAPDADTASAKEGGSSVNISVSVSDEFVDAVTAVGAKTQSAYKQFPVAGILVGGANVDYGNMTTLVTFCNDFSKLGQETINLPLLCAINEETLSQLSLPLDESGAFDDDALSEHFGVNMILPAAASGAQSTAGSAPEDEASDTPDADNPDAAAQDSAASGQSAGYTASYTMTNSNNTSAVIDIPGDFLADYANVTGSIKSKTATWFNYKEHRQDFLMLPSLIWDNQEPSKVASAIRSAHKNVGSCVFLSEVLDENVAASRGSTIQEAALASFKCGADILVFKDNAVKGIQAILAALEKGDITWQDIEERAVRIVAAKLRFFGSEEDAAAEKGSEAESETEAGALLRSANTGEAGDDENAG